MHCSHDAGVYAFKHRPVNAHAQYALQHTYDMGITENVRALVERERARTGDSLAALARRMRVGQPALHRICSGETKDPKPETIKRIAAYFSVSVDDVMSVTPIQLSYNGASAIDQLASVAFLNGTPLLLDEEQQMLTADVDVFASGKYERMIPNYRTDRPRAFAMRVLGSSMTSHAGGCEEGELIFVDPDRQQPKSGRLVVARIKESGHVVFRQYIEEGGRRWLKPMNAHYPPIFDEFSIIGTVYAMMREGLDDDIAQATTHSGRSSS